MDEDGRRKRLDEHYSRPDAMHENLLKKLNNMLMSEHFIIKGIKGLTKLYTSNKADKK